MIEYILSYLYEIIYLGEDEVFRVVICFIGLLKQKEQIGRQIRNIYSLYSIWQFY